MPKHINRATKQQVSDYYLSKPMTIDSVAERFNISCPSVSKILDEYRIRRYNKVQMFSPDLDETYFDSIDTEAKAYFLGLIITDGCVHSSKGRQSLVSLTLQDCDRYMLDIFRTELRSNKRVTSDGRGCSEINILSNGLVSGLRKYGVTERKSLNAIFPDNIPKNLYPHLIRGVFDGDGSVSYYARKNRRVHTKAVRFCQGNYSFLESLVELLWDECGVNPVSIYREKESLWSIAYRKNDSVAKVIDYMYGDAHIYLERKKKICDLVRDEIAKYGNTEITA